MMRSFLLIFIVFLSTLFIKLSVASPELGEYTTETYMELKKRISLGLIYPSRLSKKGTDSTLSKRSCVSSLFFNQSYVHRIVTEIRGIRNDNFSTLVSARRLEATAYLLQAALLLAEGDIVETGVYMGGSSVLMLKLMKEIDLCGHHFWAFDSFAGLPPPRRADKTLLFGSDNLMEKGFWSSSVDRFVSNLQDFQVWNSSTVHVVKGWFNETCRSAKVRSISFLRLDGDLFESTWDAITALYKKVVPGGFIYVDDFGSFEGCREAINTYRQRYGIYETLHYIRENNDGSTIPEKSIITFEAVWWQKRGGGAGKISKTLP